MRYILVFGVDCGVEDWFEPLGNKTGDLKRAHNKFWNHIPPRL